MAINNTQQGPVSTRRFRRGGFALLIAVIFMSVMLTFGLQLGALSYKQQVLTASSLRSQYAFYAADAGLECVLTADQQQNLFAYPASAPASAPLMKCDNSLALSSPPPIIQYNPSRLLASYRFNLDSNTHCADVMVYKPNPTIPGAKTYIYSQGYDVSCAVVASPGGRHFAYRGIKASY